jgi:FixJ family two-component response regulator
MKKIILIDDDELVRMTWKYKAESSNVELQTFSNADDFLSHESQLDRDIPIYLDSDLGSVLGEDFVVELKKLGFLIVHLATGKNTATIVKNIEYFESIRGKEPPF